jgi:hypothetical protein
MTEIAEAIKILGIIVALGNFSIFMAIIAIGKKL